MIVILGFLGGMQLLPPELRPQTLALEGRAPKPMQWRRSLRTMFHPSHIHCKLPITNISHATVYI